MSDLNRDLEKRKWLATPGLSCGLGGRELGRANSWVKYERGSPVWSQGQLAVEQGPLVVLVKALIREPNNSNPSLLRRGGLYVVWFCFCLLLFMKTGFQVQPSPSHIPDQPFVLTRPSLTWFCFDLNFLKGWSHQLLRVKILWMHPLQNHHTNI